MSPNQCTRRCGAQIQKPITVLKSFHSSSINQLKTCSSQLLSVPFFALFSISLDANTPRKQVAFTNVVADFDALAVGDRSVENLKKEINDRVYLKSYIQRDHAELQSYNKKQRKYHVRLQCAFRCPLARTH